MRPNGVRDLWNNNQGVVNGWLGIANTFSAEVVASAGYDSVTIDMQHGLVDFQSAVGMLQAISAFDITPLVRVPWNDPSIVMRSLDAGAYGIICPMINNKTECEQFVAACLYAPRGIRSFGPARARIYGGNDYLQHANDTVISFAMVESAEAVDNVSEIISVEELDAIYVGPSDLALSMGYVPFTHEDAVEDAIKHVLEESKQGNIKSAIHCPSGKSAKERLDMGFDFVTIAADFALLAQVSKSEILAAREK
jgi:4-hydroxy-2-oxoheptanedioate aldolase